MEMHVFQTNTLTKTKFFSPKIVTQILRVIKQQINKRVFILSATTEPHALSIFPFKRTSTSDDILPVIISNFKLINEGKYF